MSPGKVLEWCGVAIVASVTLIVASGALVVAVDAVKYILS